MLTASLLLTLALAPADAPTPPPDAAVSDAGQLQGEWEVVTASIDGVNYSDDFKQERWIVSGTSAGLLIGGKDIGHLTVHVYPATNTRWVEIVAEWGQLRRGVFRRSGDELCWAWDTADAGRPSSFKPGHGVIVFTLRRVKK
jgi:uncharacterized protein (TIGR03067 family)